MTITDIKRTKNIEAHPSSTTTTKEASLKSIEKKQARLLELRTELDRMPKFVSGESASRPVSNPKRVSIQREHDDLFIAIQAHLQKEPAMA